MLKKSVAHFQPNGLICSKLRLNNCPFITPYDLSKDAHRYCALQLLYTAGFLLIEITAAHKGAGRSIYIGNTRFHKCRGKK